MRGARTEPPGRVSSVGKLRRVPTTLVPSKAPRARSRSANSGHDVGLALARVAEEAHVLGLDPGDELFLLDGTHVESHPPDARSARSDADSEIQLMSSGVAQGSISLA